MARTILEIAKEAAERQGTAPAPVKLFNTDNKVAKILRTAAGDVMREYLRATRFESQSEFSSTWCFSLIPGRYAYPLPPDFLAMIPDTEHRAGSPMGLLGPATAQAWAQWVYGIGGTPCTMGWRIRNNALWIDPTPSAHELVVIDYVTRFPVVSQIEPGDYDLSQDPPLCRVPFVPRDGHTALVHDITASPSNVANYDQGEGFDVGTFPQEQHEVLKRLSPLSGTEPLPMVRRPAFTRDTDLPAFEDDHLLSLGMTFHLRRALSMDYAEAAGDYEAELERKAGQDGSHARPITIGGSGSDWEVVPLGDGRWLV